MTVASCTQLWLPMPVAATPRSTTFFFLKCLEAVRLPDARTQSDRRRDGLGLGTSLFPVGATEIKGLEVRYFLTFLSLYQRKVEYTLTIGLTLHVQLQVATIPSSVTFMFVILSRHNGWSRP